jgi:FAD/FMN-containing dehydrogenase
MLNREGRRIVQVNDIHSQLNATIIKDLRQPHDLDTLRRTIAECARAGEPLSICGARHAMGAQQFLAGGLLVDLSALTKAIAIDHDAGLLTVEPAFNGLHSSTAT